MNGKWQYFTKIFTLLSLILRKTRVYTISGQFHCKICKTQEKKCNDGFKKFTVLFLFFVPIGRICSSSCSKTKLGLRRKHVQHAGYGQKWIHIFQGLPSHGCYIFKRYSKIVRELDVKIHTHKDTQHKLDYTQFRGFIQM